jgi:hypothetical protein
MSEKPEQQGRPAALYRSFSARLGLTLALGRAFTATCSLMSRLQSNPNSSSQSSKRCC